MGRGRERMRWLDRLADTVDVKLSKLWEQWRTGVWHAAVYGVAKSRICLSDRISATGI